MRGVRPLLIASLLGALLAGALLAVTPALDRLELSSLELRFRMRPPPSSPSPVTIVFLRGLLEPVEERPLREELAELLDLLAGVPAEQRPRAVVVDMLLSGPGELSVSGSPTAGVVGAGAALGGVVHGIQLAFRAEEHREIAPQLSPLRRHSLPMAGGWTPRAAYGIRLAHRDLAPALYAGAAGAGFINLSPLPGLAGSVAHHLPLVAPLLEPGPAAGVAPGPPDGTGGEGSNLPRLYPALSLAGAGVAACGGRPLEQCLRLEGRELRLEGAVSRRIPLDPERGGELWINHRRRFLLELEPHRGLPSERALEPVSSLAANPPEVLLFETRSAGRPALVTLEGRRLAPADLAGQVLLVADMREQNVVRSPFGEGFRQSSVHAQVMANILEDDFLRRPPSWTGWAAALALLGVALAWQVRRLRPAPALAPASSRPFPAAFRSAVTAPEGLLAATWTAATLGAFCAWSVWVPLVLPLGVLAGSAAGRRLVFPRLLRREVVRLSAEIGHQERRLEALADRTAELSEVRAQLEELRGETERQSSFVSAELQAAVAVSEGDILELDRLLETAQRVLAEQLPRAAEGSLAVTAWIEAPDLSGRLRQARAEVSRLLLEVRDAHQEIERERPWKQTIEQWLEVRRVAYQALLGQVQGMLFDASDQLARLRPAIAEQAEPPAPAGEPDPELLEATGCLTVDPRMIRTLREVVTRIGPSRLGRPVLILGESGTGKELIARAIHRAGPHPKAPLLSFNCAALTPSLVESELFGHVRGAFSGADRDRPGMFVEADGGTLFMDELGEMPLELQAKVLRVIETGEVRPVGGGAKSVRTVRVRLVAATHADLEALVREGRFRLDLYHRLSATVVRLPPLRERRGDVGLLAARFARDAGGRIGRSIGLEAGAIAVLEAYAWPGNVRELRNAIEDLADHPGLERITARDVRERLGMAGAALEVSERSVFTPEEQALLEMLRRHQFREEECGSDPGYPGNRAAAGRHLRVLICKALRASSWQVGPAARLLVGEGHFVLAPSMERRIQRLIRSLGGRLEPAGGPVGPEGPAGEGPPASIPEATYAAIKRQYRSDFLHVLRVLEALQRGVIGVEAESAASDEPEEPT